MKIRFLPEECNYYTPHFSNLQEEIFRSCIFFKKALRANELPFMRSACTVLNQYIPLKVCKIPRAVYLLCVNGRSLVSVKGKNLAGS